MTFFKSDPVNILPAKVEKPWGYELIYAKTEKYVGKILYVFKGQQLSLQYHRIKDETMYMLKGTAELSIGQVRRETHTKVFSAGMTYRIEPGIVHRLTALEDCEVLEVSTPELSDVVRLKDRYGRI